MSSVFVGIDLGGKFHQVQVTSAEGGRLGRSFRISRGQAGLDDLRSGIEERVGRATRDVVYTVEATQNAGWSWFIP